MGARRKQRMCPSRVKTARWGAPSVAILIKNVERKLQLRVQRLPGSKFSVRLQKSIKVDNPLLGTPCHDDDDALGKVVPDQRCGSRDVVRDQRAPVRLAKHTKPAENVTQLFGFHLIPFSILDRVVRRQRCRSRQRRQRRAGAHRQTGLKCRVVPKELHGALADVRFQEIRNALLAAEFQTQPRLPQNALKRDSISMKRRGGGGRPSLGICCVCTHFRSGEQEPAARRGVRFCIC